VLNRIRVLQVLRAPGLVRTMTFECTSGRQCRDGRLSAFN
jgi:hypothetical protein